jgi:hypothetical protein
VSNAAPPKVHPHVAAIGPTQARKRLRERITIRSADRVRGQTSNQTTLAQAARNRSPQIGYLFQQLQHQTLEIGVRNLQSAACR